MTITLFSWGYWGWGNATERLVEAVDAAERVQGFQPPIFIDARLRRQGRAKGFVGDAFRDLVSQSRYRHMQNLGNQEIATGGTGVQIKNPAAVAELLELALHAADENRRVIFFCACEFPKRDGVLACHRLTITELLLEHARRVNQALTVVEWPGGKPLERRLEMDRKQFAAVMRGDRKSIPFASERLKEFAGLPWASVAVVEREGTGSYILVGPARFATSKSEGGSWYLPIIESPDPDATKEMLLQLADKWRTERGLNEYVSG